MTLPPIAPLNVGLLDALERLGLKGGHLPTLVGDVTPVMVMGDLSRTITAELVEARRLGHWYVDPTLGNWALIQLDCRSPGGLVIEALDVVSGDQAGNDVREVRFQITASPPAEVFFGGPRFVDIGGIPGVSELFATGSRVGDPFILGLPYGAIWLQTTNTIGGVARWYGTAQTRIFVQAGESIRFRTSAANVDLGVILTWREMPPVEGTGAGG